MTTTRDTTTATTSDAAAAHRLLRLDRRAREPRQPARPAGLIRAAYPHDLAVLVHEQWSHAVASLDGPQLSASGAPVVPLPGLPVLEHLLSVCYQASLLHEEARPVTFRLALIEPEELRADEGPPGGLHRLVFAKSRTLDAHELRRLASAAPFHRALIGARLDAEFGPQIWGIIHSGPRWLQAVRGGRHVQQAVPPALMVAVTGPGRVLVSAGATTIAELSGGSLSGASFDVFKARWLAEVFAEIRDVQASSHATARAATSVPWAALDPDFGPMLAEHVLRRIVATIRGAHHGGTLIVVPSRVAHEVLGDGRCVTLKYAFRDEEPRRRIVTLIVQAMNELAGLHDPSLRSGPVGWADFERCAGGRLAALDEAVFEVAHLVAALAGVDGAVVMTRRLELLGFGGEISGSLPETATVAHALDLDGAQRERVRTDRVGTRHRSAYRLCQALPDTVAIVISQDGGVRFVRWQNGAVTYWDQVATGPWEV